jgi:hypothetical protein
MLGGAEYTSTTLRGCLETVPNVRRQHIGDMAFSFVFPLRHQVEGLAQQGVKCEKATNATISTSFGSFDGSERTRFFSQSK